ncbi:hypothetical protein G7Y79_00006g018220 [Physcia stellaris]|nr:hypothetical protein G7Y79_00006g018220 [Physcia stellaris]
MWLTKPIEFTQKCTIVKSGFLRTTTNPHPLSSQTLHKTSPYHPHKSLIQRTLRSTTTMLLIGLTGNIATGKSTVARLLSSPPYSLPLIDADVLAREVVLPGTPAYRKIVEYFGPTTPDLLLPFPSSSNEKAQPPSQTSSQSPIPQQQPSPPPSTSKSNAQEQGRPLDRASLGRRVFGSSPSRKRDRAILNSIIHPAVRRAIFYQILSYYLRGHWALILDIPLLYESSLDPYVSFVLLIASSPETQMRRLLGRDPHLSAREAEDRVGSQMGVGEKVGRTEARGKGRGVVVRNEGSREELERGVAEVMRGLEGRRGCGGFGFGGVRMLLGRWLVGRFGRGGGGGGSGRRGRGSKRRREQERRRRN